MFEAVWVNSCAVASRGGRLRIWCLRMTSQYRSLQAYTSGHERAMLWMKIDPRGDPLPEPGKRTWASGIPTGPTSWWALAGMVCVAAACGPIDGGSDTETPETPFGVWLQANHGQPAIDVEHPFHGMPAAIEVFAARDSGGIRYLEQSLDGIDHELPSGRVGTRGVWVTRVTARAVTIGVGSEMLLDSDPTGRGIEIEDGWVFVLVRPPRGGGQP